MADANEVKSEDMPTDIEPKVEENNIPKKCGLIMPISAMDGYSESHWKDVRNILAFAVQDAGFEAKIVSESDDIGVIHQRIVQNIYDNPMIVCDISGRNPNVMFELGLRLAFDKPTIIVKDEVTQYSFDTSVIEHLTYPKDLRYQRIENFKTELKERIEKTYSAYIKDPEKYSTFLKNFGSFTVPQLEENIVPINEFLVNEIKGIKKSLDEIRLRTNSQVHGNLTSLNNVEKNSLFELEDTDFVLSVTILYKSKLDQDFILNKVRHVFDYTEIKYSASSIRISLERPYEVDEVMDIVDTKILPSKFSRLVGNSLFLKEIML